MKEQKTPQEKKALAYAKDHFDVTEHPHLFRKSWPRKKARANRSYRRHIHQRLTEIQKSHDDPELYDIRHPDAVRRSIVRKWRPVQLTIKVKRRLETRVLYRVGSIMWKEYDSEKFAAFLQAHLKSRTPFTRELALYLNELLEPPEVPEKAIPVHETVAWQSNARRDWLKSFFRDAPDWESRLRQWIRELH